MDNAVLAALARWPNVPAVYEWLSLDRRGSWRLQGDAVRHPGLAAFISRNYAVTTSGEWFLQNGPQRVFVTLAYTPWILRWHPDTGLQCHTGLSVTAPSEAWLDEAGNLLIRFEGGVGLVCDQDLPSLLDHFGLSPHPTKPEGAAAFEKFLANSQNQPLWLHLREWSLPVGLLHSGEVPDRFGFDPHPQPRP